MGGCGLCVCLFVFSVQALNAMSGPVFLKRTLPKIRAPGRLLVTVAITYQNFVFLMQSSSRHAHMLDVDNHVACLCVCVCARVCVLCVQLV